MRTMWFGAIFVSLLFLQACASSQSNEAPRRSADVRPTARQATDTDMEVLMQKVKADKKLLVANNMNLSDAEAKQFWPLYDAYQKELGQINQRLGKTIMEYGEAYNKGPVPNDTAEKLLNEALVVEEAEVNLKRSYAEELGKVLPTTKVARYMQVETKIRSLLRLELAQQIPLIY